MEKYSYLEYIFKKINDNDDISSLHDLLIDIRSEFDLANIVYHAVHVPDNKVNNPLLILTYEQDWVNRYVERDYFRIDPVVSFGRRGFLPIDWSEVDRDTFGAKQFFAEADRFGVGRQGVTMPIRGPAGERALFTVTSNASGAEWKTKRLAYMREFQLIGHFFHDRAVQVSGLRAKFAYPKLSNREIECLREISRGLAPKAIAGKLNLSISAVQIYLQSARHKLCCSSTAEAVVKAFRLELFD